MSISTKNPFDLNSQFNVVNTKSFDIDTKTHVLKSAIFSPIDDNLVVVVMESYSGMQEDYGKLHLWNVKDDTIVHTIEGDRFMFATFSPDGTKIASITSQANAMIWNIETGEKITIPLMTINTHSVNFSPCGTQIITAGNQVKIWDLQTSALIRTLQTDDRWHIKKANFSPDGTKIVTASKKVGGIIWDSQTGEQIYQLSLGRMYDANFSPNGKLVVTASSDGYIRIWNIETGVLIQTINLNYPVILASFSPDGTKIITSAGGFARVWDVNTGTVIHTLNHTKQLVRFPHIIRANYSHNGIKIVTVSENVKIWEEDPIEKELYYLELKRVLRNSQLSTGNNGSSYLSNEFSQIINQFAVF
jgi:WD40 repeat protein